MLGSTVEVTGIDGSYSVMVPAGVASGQKLRVGGKGVTRKGDTGDLLVEIKIDGSLVKLDDESRKLAERLREAVSS